MRTSLRTRLRLEIGLNAYFRKQSLLEGNQEDDNKYN